MDGMEGCIRMHMNYEITRQWHKHWRSFGKADWAVARPGMEQKTNYILLQPTALTDSIQRRHTADSYAYDSQRCRLRVRP